MSAHFVYIYLWAPADFDFPYTYHSFPILAYDSASCFGYCWILCLCWICHLFAPFWFLGPDFHFSFLLLSTYVFVSMQAISSGVLEGDVCRACAYVTLLLRCGHIQLRDTLPLPILLR